MRTYYEIIGVGEFATTEEITYAYKRRAMLLHPDKNPDVNPDAMVLLNAAYECLSDSHRRTVYDMSLMMRAMPDEEPNDTVPVQIYSVKEYDIIVGKVTLFSVFDAVFLFLISAALVDLIIPMIEECYGL